MEALRDRLPKFSSHDQEPTSAAPAPPLSDSGEDTSAPSSFGEPHDGMPSPIVAHSGVIELPKMVIRPFPLPRSEPPSPLPRIPLRPTHKDVQIHDFTSPAAKEKLLVEKHISPLDRFFLSRYTLPLFGISKEKRAREIESSQQAAQQLNHIADIIDLSHMLGVETEEDKKLRQEYIRLLRSQRR